MSPVRIAAAMATLIALIIGAVIAIESVDAAPARLEATTVTVKMRVAPEENQPITPTPTPPASTHNSDAAAADAFVPQN